MAAFGASYRRATFGEGPCEVKKTQEELEKDCAWYVQALTSRLYSARIEGAEHLTEIIDNLIKSRILLAVEVLSQSK